MARRARKTKGSASVETFEASLRQTPAPPEISRALAALWHAAKGDWKKAHDLAQQQDDERGAWVHGYLHRVEGDLSNADYWYQQAGRKRPTSSLENEWRAIVTALVDTAEDGR
jgi:hypothetical protein